MNANVSVSGHRHRRPQRLRVLLGSLVGLAAAGAAVVGVGGSAQAATPYMTGTANVRSCTNTGNGTCAPFTTFGGGTAVTMVCWRDESWATGAYSSNRWFLVRRGDGLEGFVHSSLVGQQVGTPSCSSIPRVMAGIEAINRLGQVYANQADAGLFTAADWGNPYAEWSGDCKKYVWTAYYRGTGTRLIGGNAKPTFDTYWANRAEKGYGYPRYGSLVGYDIALPYGHIAVSIGGDRIATTQGMDGARLATTVRSTSSFGAYKGWVVP